jgi:glycine/D-amino acid oxidase-like deaminating enzyme/nitrite reductase/ring-hydroxylating ferredoxin subunit
MDNGATASVWTDGLVLPAYPPLGDDTYADVCIVGAGISGLTTAYLLAREGHTVVVLDQGDIGAGETGRTTGHLTSLLDDRYFDIEHIHGEYGARLAIQSHQAAIDKIESIVSSEDIACELTRVDGYLILDDADGPAVLDRELSAIRRAGLTDVAVRHRAPDAPFDTGPCLHIPRQGQLNPLPYLTALAKAVIRDGGRLYGDTRAVEMSGGTTARVRTASGHTVTAGAVVVATNTPVNDVVTIHVKQSAYRTYVIGLTLPQGAMPPALYYDTARPYHYVRVRPSPDGRTPDMVLVGGEDHRTGQADDPDRRFARLEQWARDRLPDAGVVAYRWSGQIVEPVDSLGFIGRNPGVIPNIYVATGDSGNGLTHGTIAGILLTDLIAGRDNPWSKLYDPSRRSVRTAAGFVRDNLNVAAHYTRWVTPGEVRTPLSIPPGQGAVIRRGIHKIACYRDDNGVLHEVSAVCPHLFCLVDWNSTERTWDCPCHGSRFDPYGAVINGPAVDNLPPIVDTPHA